MSQKEGLDENFGAATAAPKGLFDGAALGFSKSSRYDAKSQKVDFFAVSLPAINAKPVLTLKGTEAAKWRKWQKEAGGCYLDYPMVQASQPTGGKGTIYRFEGGVIVTSPKGTFFLRKEIAQAWERNGGYNPK